MKCNKTESDYIDYIYGEMSKEESAEFEKHMADCPRCQAELAELRHTRNILQQIPETLTGLNNHPVYLSRWYALKQLLPGSLAGRIGMGIAAAFFIVVVIGSLARLNIRYSNGDFDIQLGGSLPVHNTISTDQENQIVRRIEKKNYEVLNTWLQNFQDQQNREIKQVLADYSYALQNRQDQQFSALGNALQQFYTHTDQRFKQTDLVLDNLIQTTKYSQ